MKIVPWVASFAAMAPTSSGVTIRRFECFFLNQGSGNWIETVRRIESGTDSRRRLSQIIALQKL